MDNSTQSNPIESIMSTTMENLKQMIDVNVVVGDAVETGEGATIIPISRVSFGFVAGGGEYSCAQQPAQTQKLPFAGGTGTGVSVNPMGFLVVGNDGQVKLLPAQYYAPIDRIIEMVPDLMSEIKEKIKNCGCKSGSHKYGPEDGVSPSGIPNHENEHQYAVESGMFVSPTNVPCAVYSESAQNMHPTIQCSFEDPTVQDRMKQHDGVGKPAEPADKPPEPAKNNDAAKGGEQHKNDRHKDNNK